MPRLLLWTALVWVLAAPAAGAEVGPIEPDRPDAADSAKTVPAGAVQVETGVKYARTRAAGVPTEGRLAVDTVVRGGVTERFEVQLGGEPLVRLRGADEDTGFGDVTLAAKYRVLDAREGAWWPAVGLVPFVKLPTADAPIGTERPNFGLTGLGTFDLPANFGLDVNVGLAAIGQTQPGGYLLQGLVALSLQHDLLPERVQGFVEMVFTSREERGERDRVGVDTGVIVRLTPALALDAAVETSLAGRGPDWAVRAGLSARFGR